jgi:hypothetical protein
MESWLITDLVIGAVVLLALLVKSSRRKTTQAGDD